MHKVMQVCLDESDSYNKLDTYYKPDIFGVGPMLVVCSALTALISFYPGIFFGDRLIRLIEAHLYQIEWMLHTFPHLFELCGLSICLVHLRVPAVKPFVQLYIGLTSFFTWNHPVSSQNMRFIEGGLMGVEPTGE